MSYLITIDGITLYDPNERDYYLLSAKLEQELNSSGTLSLTIPHANPSYGLAKLMKSVVKLYEDGTLIFEGRPYAPSYNVFRDDKLIIEGELAYLNDSVYQPYLFNGSVSDFFTSLIENHNSQVDERRKFKVGNISVVNSTAEGNITRSDEDYTSTMQIINDKLVSKLGGYLVIRHEEDGRYIDYIEDITTSINQPVTQAINLIDAKETISPNELATVILPLGSKNEVETSDGEITEEYVTIKGVNGGSIYLESEEGIEKYGRIVKTVHHDDITLDTNLLSAARKDLSNAMGLTRTINISAADLSKAGYTQYDSFRIGNYVRVKVQTMGIDESMIIRKLSLDLFNPGSNVLTLGSKTTTLTDENQKTTSTLENKIVEVNRQATERTINQAIQTIREVNALITNSAEQLTSQFSEKYYDKDNVDNLLSEISTTITQTADAITFSFNQWKSGQESTNDDTQAQFQEISKYIRFINGNIELGESSNPMILRLENDKISFLENGVEVSWWENQSFHVTEGVFETSLKLGKFSFIPRASGNLSFKKVED